MIVNRNKLSWFERTYIPALWGGFCVTLKHVLNTLPFVGKKGPVTLQYPEDRTKCVSCQLCEFVCPPRAIKIIPPGPETDPTTGNVEKRPKDFEINMLRCIFCGLCQEVCPEEAIFLQKDYSLNGESREEMVYGIDKLLALGGTHNDTIQKWKKKEDDANAQAAH
jgi:NADH-quinone oxidoreductase subunit I